MEKYGKLINKKELKSIKFTKLIML